MKSDISCPNITGIFV